MLIRAIISTEIAKFEFVKENEMNSGTCSQMTPTWKWPISPRRHLWRRHHTKLGEVKNCDWFRISLLWYDSDWFSEPFSKAMGDGLTRFNWNPNSSQFIWNIMKPNIIGMGIILGEDESNLEEEWKAEQMSLTLEKSDFRAFCRSRISFKSAMTPYIKPLLKSVF